ncbi:hypothetical protein WJX81_000838 [Elliptochloris bilobata]|uniref:ZZ-type domain-containing protein n=1 Tax=Elliptochloris bilobata TaxID=381761 RepID=A0AAW1SIC2_9CHLO
MSIWLSAGTRMRITDPTADACTRLQRPERHDYVEDGLPALLHNAIGSQEGLYCAAVCGHVDHYHYFESDHTWSCGWRNIQMISSHLIKQEEFADKVFGGAGFVPDILSLQAWLECAWRRGFDPDGARQLGWHVQGSHIWIGTTEAATLLRQFGVRARVVDFTSRREASKLARRRHSASWAQPVQLRGASERDEEAGEQMEAGKCRASSQRAEAEDHEGGGAPSVEPARVESARGAPARDVDVREDMAPRDEDAVLHGGARSGKDRHGSVGQSARAEELRGASEGHESEHESEDEDMETVTMQQGGQELNVHRGIRCDLCGQAPILGTRFQSKWLSNYDLCQACHAKPKAQKNAPYGEVMLTTQREARLVDHRQLMQWVWNYFTDELSSGAEPPTETRDHAWREHIEDDPVILSCKPPLYLQHQGHSRTLIGVERIQLHPGHAAEVSLLLLDPGLLTQDLVAALRSKHGWQDMLKRNLCTFKMSEYQLMYIADGVATGAELAELQEMRAIQKF